jgi:hypothetical protein
MASSEPTPPGYDFVDVSETDLNDWRPMTRLYNDGDLSDLEIQSRVIAHVGAHADTPTERSGSTTQHHRVGTRQSVRDDG